MILEGDDANLAEIDSLARREIHGLLGDARGAEVDFLAVFANDDADRHHAGDSSFGKQIGDFPLRVYGKVAFGQECFDCGCDVLIHRPRRDTAGGVDPISECEHQQAVDEVGFDGRRREGEQRVVDPSFNRCLERRDCGFTEPSDQLVCEGLVFESLAQVLEKRSRESWGHGWGRYGGAVTRRVIVAAGNDDESCREHDCTHPKKTERACCGCWRCVHCRREYTQGRVETTKDTYLGHDQLAVVETTLVRRFPLYREGDSNAEPTGGTRLLRCKLAKAEAGWLLELDKVVNY